MAAATAVFAAVHSLLASEGAKQRAVRLAGPTSGTALYRAFYNVQAVVSFGLLLRYGSRLPAATVYHIDGPRRRLLRLIQGAGWAWALWAVREVGIARLSGADTARGLWRRGDAPAPPAAQGPEQDASGRLTRGGPFRWSRHPLNLAPLPVLWATPHMTFRRLGFNLVATAYLAAGSFHEERRLARRYGETYERYRLSAPFYLPCPPSLYRKRKTPVQALRLI